MKLLLVALLFLSGSMLVASTGGPIEELISGASSGEVGHESGSGGVGGSSKSSEKSGGENSLVVPTKSQDKTVLPAAIGGALLGGAGGHGGVLGHLKEGFLGAKGPAELLKLMLNPIEFCKRVAKHYKLHFGKFILILQKGATFGLELALQPALLTLKIIEKIFVPDACKLKLICKCAHPLSFTKEHMPKFSSKFLAGSHIIKAMSDGFLGHDCEVTYSGCSKGAAPKLKKEYEAAGQQQQQQQQQQPHKSSTESGNHEQGNHEHQATHGEQAGEQYESSNVSSKTLKSVG